MYKRLHPAAAEFRHTRAELARAIAALEQTPARVRLGAGVRAGKHRLTPPGVTKRVRYADEKLDARARARQ
jgi:hypothetical protein